MKAYETSATIDKGGTLHVEGVPFAPGTHVEVTITSRESAAPEGQPSVGQLFAALDKARNTESVGPLNRAEIYDRKVLR